MKRFSVFAVGVAGLQLSACTNDDVTYAKDIAPLVQRECASCHSAGGIGPFPLLTYDDVIAHKDMVLLDVETRRMPPFIIDNSGACQTFKDARWLTDGEIALFKAWVDGGAAPGDVASLAPAAPRQEQRLAGAVSLQMESAYTPTSSTTHPNDDYRCFFLDPQLAEDTHMTGYEIAPGVPAEVHHMLLFSLLTPEAEAQAQALDDAAPGAGWECFGDAGVSDFQMLAAWAPGSSVVRYPEGTGLYVPKERRFVMQIHYNLLAGVIPDQTSLKVSFQKDGVTEAIMAPLAENDFRLQPGLDSVSTSLTYSLAVLPANLIVHGVFPHMHQMGRKLNLTTQPLGDTDDRNQTCMAKVEAWDFNWQQNFFYEAPFVIGPSDRVDLRCEWNTTTATGETVWGENTSDEMCLAFLYVTLESGASPRETFDL
jgi:hypothetical protein